MGDSGGEEDEEAEENLGLAKCACGTDDAWRAPSCSSCAGNCSNASAAGEEAKFVQPAPAAPWVSDRVYRGILKGIMMEIESENDRKSVITVFQNGASHKYM
jgi:hypothetical protein